MYEMKSAAQTMEELSTSAAGLSAQEAAAALFGGGALAGSVLQLNVALKNVAEVTGLPLSELVKSSSYTAARALGLPGIGKLEPGYQADVVLLDADFRVMKTFVDGELRFER